MRLSQVQAVEDLYPSRVRSQPKILQRKDPVVYANSYKSAIITKDQQDYFHRNGYLFLERFFSDQDIERYREELQKIWNASAHSTAEEVVREPHRNTVRSVFAVHQNNSVFKKAAKDRRLVGMVEHLLDSEAYVHQSRINFKPGFYGKEFYWHSDFETWHVEDGMPRMRAISCSVALEDNDFSNGSLMIVPGSHRYYVSCVGKTPENHYKQSLRMQEYGVPDQESLQTLIKQGGLEMPTGPKGSVLLFDCNLMHGSNSNISPFPRSNVFIVYNSVENKLVDPFSKNEPRPGFIATRS